MNLNNVNEGLVVKEKNGRNVTLAASLLYTNVHLKAMNIIPYQASGSTVTFDLQQKQRTSFYILRDQDLNTAFGSVLIDDGLTPLRYVTGSADKEFKQAQFIKVQYTSANEINFMLQYGDPKYQPKKEQQN